MVNLRGRFPRRAGMAALAGIGRADMQRCFSFGRCAVVADRARARHLYMINFCCWLKRDRVMARFAYCAAANVRYRFANCSDTVMATETILRDLTVINRREC